MSKETQNFVDAIKSKGTTKAEDTHYAAALIRAGLNKQLEDLQVEKIRLEGKAKRAEEDAGVKAQREYDAAFANIDNILAGCEDAVDDYLDNLVKAETALEYTKQEDSNRKNAIEAVNAKVVKIEALKARFSAKLEDYQQLNELSEE